VKSDIGVSSFSSAGRPAKRRLAYDCDNARSHGRLPVTGRSSYVKISTHGSS